MQETIISMNGIEKSYGKHKVLNDINLTINKGDIFGLVGRNGAGKTTLFKILLGLSDYQHGTIQIGPNHEKLSEARKHIGFFIGGNFFPYLTARENLEYYRDQKGIQDKNEVDRVLKLVDLDQVDSKFKNFSLGMKQRLGIANALMGSPEILILDEPVNGLDPQGIADIRHLVQKLNEEYGMTIIISSHILGELQNTAHSFGIVNEGSIARIISREDLKTDKKAVRIDIDDLDKARTALNQAGVKILGEVQESSSLEDYYFKLLGGRDND